MLFEANGLLTLTSDFGLRDGYVGAMKGAALSVDRAVRLIDIAHDLPAQDVLHAARVLASAAPRFPVGTVHVAVIDPGVGTDRAPIALAAGGHIFVGPDNGLFSLVTEVLGGCEGGHRIVAHPFLAATPSATFEGRDVFAPTGSALAGGRLALSDVGPNCAPSLVRTEARSRREPGAVSGEVVLVDRFGNLVTNISHDELQALGERVAVCVGDQSLPLLRTYSDVGAGRGLALVGSEGWLEIAVRDGSALDTLGLGQGTPVVVSATD